MRQNGEGENVIALLFSVRNACTYFRLSGAMLKVFVESERGFFPGHWQRMEILGLQCG